MQGTNDDEILEYIVKDFRTKQYIVLKEEDLDRYYEQEQDYWEECREDQEDQRAEEAMEREFGFRWRSGNSRLRRKSARKSATIWTNAAFITITWHRDSIQNPVSRI